MKQYLMALASLSVFSFIPQLAHGQEFEYSEEPTYVINLDASGGSAEADQDSVKDREYYYDFGRVPVGYARRVNFELRNNSSTPIYIKDIDIDGVGFSRSENCPRILLRGQQCRARVTFAPDHNGQHRGDLEFDLTGAEDIEVHLRGRGGR